MKKYSVHIIWLIVVIAAFVGGTYYPSTTNSAATSASSTRGFGGRGGNGGGFAMGQVLSKDSQSITVQLPGGNSEVVFYSSSTQVIKPSPASIADLVAGMNVTIGGAQNPDGSVTAQTIQIRASSTTIRGG